MTITTDAYAQTNTERLITVVDNTNEANSLLTDLLAAVTNGFAQVLEMLGAVDSDLQAIHGDLEAIDGDLHAIDDDLQAIHGDLEALDSDMQSLANTVGGLGAAASAITSINQGITANAASITALSEKLDMISEAVGAVEEAVETAPAVAGAVGPELHRGEIEYDVPVSAFGDNDADDTVFKSALVFSCASDVFLNTGSENIPDAGNVFSDGTDLVSTVIVDGTTLYDTNYDVGATTRQLFSVEQSFGLDELKADSSIVIAVATSNSRADIGTADGEQFSLFEYVNASSRGTAVDTTGDDAGDTSRADAGKVELFTITLDWYSTASDAECTVTPPTGPTVDYEPEDKTVSLVLSAMTGETGLIKDITEATAECSGDTAVTMVRVEGIPPAFVGFVGLALNADDNVVDLEFIAETEDDDQGNPVNTGALVSVLEDPLEFHAGEVFVSGTMPVDAALARVTYNTVEDASCKAQ